jgi:hypothetical protein
MASVHAINAAKQALREVITQVSRDIVTAEVAALEGKPVRFARNGLGGGLAYHQVPLSVPDPEAPSGVQQVCVDRVTGKNTSLDDVRAVRDELTGRLDSSGSPSVRGSAKRRRRSPTS